jgi:Pentapeptide repeats (8 copies)
MANEEHVALLKQGVAAWNAWRNENSSILPDLSRAGLSRADLDEANLDEANLHQAELSRAKLRRAFLMRAQLGYAQLRGAKLSDAYLSDASLFHADLHDADLEGAGLIGANLNRANLRHANLRGASLVGARLIGADLEGARLTEANLKDATFRGANLREANLCRADLWAATLMDTDLTGADLTGCRIYGISAWGLKLDNAKQQNLVITSDYEPEITLDNIEVAQFIYLLVNNQKIRDVIDTITSKTVLILGRFTAERKPVLDALREELRKHNYLPILFDFVVPATRDITETVSLLARMARFVVADITDAKSIPQELAVIVPGLPSVPVQPLLLEGSAEYGMFEHFKRYPWVLETYRYPSPERLIADLGERVIGPAENYAQSIR